MKTIRSGAVVIAIVGGTWMLAQTGAANAQAVESTEAGDSLYRTYCASCHGPSGRGDGPVAAFLKVPPANPTQIAKRSNGVFPSERVYQIIDGRQVAKPHGSSQMPIWGDAFAKSTSGTDAAAVTAKIKALVEYLAANQEKAPASRDSGRSAEGFRASELASVAEISAEGLRADLLAVAPTDLGNS